MTGTILHVDLDAFFAAVEQRDRPELRGKPVVVGGGGPSDRGRRQRGVVRGAPASASTRRCRCATASGGSARTASSCRSTARQYQRVSREVMAILRRFTPLVEPISIDEAFLDVTGIAALFGDGETIARAIKDGDPRRGRADRLGRRRDDEARGQDRLRPAQARRARRRAAGRGGGVPRAAPDRAAVGRRREDRGGAGATTACATIGDLAGPADRTSLVRRFGKHGASLVDRARGLDADPVRDGDPAKSVGHEHTFDVGHVAIREVIERTLLAMAEGVAGGSGTPASRPATVAVKIRDSGVPTRSPGSGRCPSRPT